MSVTWSHARTTRSESFLSSGLRSWEIFRKSKFPFLSHGPSISSQSSSLIPPDYQFVLDLQQKTIRPKLIPAQATRRWAQVENRAWLCCPERLFHSRHQWYAIPMHAIPGWGYAQRTLKHRNRRNHDQQQVGAFGLHVVHRLHCRRLVWWAWIKAHHWCQN